MKNNQRVRIIPLGGMLEIGKNLTLIEYKDDIIIVDCGMTFPDHELLGIDSVIPDITYLIQNKDRIRAMVLTHGHEDHIGAIPYVLKRIKMPIYGTPLTIGLLKNKLKEHNVGKVDLHDVQAGDNVKLGKMEVEWIHVNHSIPGACCLAVKTPLGYIFHSGDFKVDYTPISGEVIDLNRIAEIGNAGVLCMISESTNIIREGFTMSESKVGETFNRIFAQAGEQRIIIATFASNVHRVQQIINAAEKYNRKVVLSGRSMLNVTETAMKLGYMKVKKDTIIDVKDMNKYDDGDLVLITTGSQGEPMSALTRIAYNEHRKIQLTPNDLVILSAHPIPGNEKAVSSVINKLLESGAKVIYESLGEIHVSGHACEEEHKLLHALVRPKYFVPNHGEYRHLLHHAEIAESMGTPRENIYIMENGNVLEISQSGAKLVADVPSGDIFVDGLGIGDVGNIVLRDRKHLSEDGLIAVVLTLSKKEGRVISGPDIISRGFVYVRESGDLMDDARDVVKKTLSRMENQKLGDWVTLKSAIRDDLKRFLFDQTKRNPMILPIIMEI
ncbi:ribonuclease J [Peptoniphilus equinus]|uniref:Ribonuclease J n=1 Tax=Peptoniphilus equinus TaxID=3016343 RepID=A0ABY7QU74_9FIRM|nr:ribonuclease J [Peptoniphilus equinus]WBW50331.1 ribonuclease J [Peptoniphilus equinus]